MSQTHSGHYCTVEATGLSFSVSLAEQGGHSDLQSTFLAAAEIALNLPNSSLGLPVTSWNSGSPPERAVVPGYRALTSLIQHLQMWKGEDVLSFLLSLKQSIFRDCIWYHQKLPVTFATEFFPVMADPPILPWLFLWSF